MESGHLFLREMSVRTSWDREEGRPASDKKQQVEIKE
jgi:hypothetical protein